MREYKTKMSGERRTRNYHSKLVARDRYYKDLQHVAVHKKNLVEAGMEWFNNGFSLDDASEEMRNNNSFIDGYNRGIRIAAINKQLFELGRQWYLDGRRLEDAIEKYQKNEHFCNGYESGELDLNTKKR